MVERVLETARGELGTMESPANSNSVKYNTWFYGRAVSGAAYPWCMAFVQWVFARAEEELPYLTASCSALLGWYRANRPEAVVKDPRPGDIAIYSFGHTGIVEAVGRDGTITAIEGNTSPGAAGSQSNGGMVCRRTRAGSAVTAFIRPEREEADAPAGAETDGVDGAAARMDNTPAAAHREGVEWCRENGILKGDAAGDLRLSRPVTRQELCTMLKRLADRSPGT